MTFGTLLSEFNSLRRRLVIFVKPGVEEITIEPPKGDSDELSFMRLVAWGYVMLHENARIPLGFLKSLPPWNSPNALLPHVGALRTSLGHNLAFDNSRDVKTVRVAAEWFQAACGASRPLSVSQWKSCFDTLLAELLHVLGLAIQATENLSNQIDGARLVHELQMRIDRDWPAHRFDTYVDAAVKKFGYGLDPTQIRGVNVTTWRKVLVAAHEDEIEQVLTQRIEADVLDLMAHALPLQADEVAKVLNYPNKAALAAALLVLRAAGPANALDVVGYLRNMVMSVVSQPILPEDVVVRDSMSNEGNV